MAKAIVLDKVEVYENLEGTKKIFGDSQTFELVVGDVPNRIKVGHYKLVLIPIKRKEVAK